MVKITVYDNIFSENFTQHSAEPGTTVKEAYSFNEEQAVIYINGLKVDANRILRDGDICSIHIAPEGAAVLIGAVLLGGAAGAWWVSSGTAKKFFHWVGDKVKSGLADMLGIDDLSDTSNSSTIEKIPTLKGSKNQSGLDKPIPLILGKHLFTPYYCGSPYTLIDPHDGSDGENQYFYALYMIGYSPVLISDIRIGELLLSSNVGKVINGKIGVTAESYFYDNPVASLISGATAMNCTLSPDENGLLVTSTVIDPLTFMLIKNEGYSISGKTCRKLKVRIKQISSGSGMTYGFISYEKNGNTSQLLSLGGFVNTFIPNQWYDYSFDLSSTDDLMKNTLTGFVCRIRGPLNAQYVFECLDIVSSATYDAALEIQQSDEVSFYPQKIIQENLEIMLYNAAGTRTEPIRFSASNPQKVQVELTVNGLLGYSTDGKLENRNIEIQIQWRPRNGTDSQWVSFPQIDGSTSYAAGVSTITRQKNKQMRFVATYNFSYSEIMGISTADVEIRVIRINEQGDDNRTTDDVIWSAIRTWCFNKEESLAAGSLIPQIPVTIKDRLKTTRLGIKIKASEDLEGTLEKVNLIAASIARTWNGSAWTTMEEAIENRTVSNNTASVALLALQQPHIGNEPYTDAEIDLAGFGKSYEFCAIKGIHADGVVITTMKEEDLINKILYTARSQLIIKDGKYSPCIDNERAYPVTVFNQQNTMSASNTKTFDVLPDGLRITFINQDDGYQTNEVCVMRDGKKSTDPDATFKDIDVPFLTDVSQAWKLGRYILACMQLRPETWTRKISIEGFALNIGSLVSVQDDTILVGMNDGGFIKEVLNNGSELTGIVTDSYFDMLDGYSYGVKIVQSNSDGSSTIRTAQVITHQGMVNQLDFLYPIPITESKLPSIDDLVAFGEYEKITQDALVVGKTPSNDGTYEITLVPYDEGIYSADSGAIPEYDTKLTKPLPTVLQELIAKPRTIIPGPKGDQGAPGSGSIVTITNPLETNALYETGQFGAYSGYLYTWTKTGTATGYWTISAQETVSYDEIDRYYSFDDLISEGSEKLICIDNSGNQNHAKAIGAEITQGYRGKALSLTTRSSYIKL